MLQVLTWIWWGILGILSLEDLKTKQLSFLWILLLGLDGVGIKAVELYETFLQGQLSMPILLFGSLIKGGLLGLFMGALLYLSFHRQVGAGDLWVIFFIGILFPLEKWIMGTLFAFIHAGFNGILLMTFRIDKKGKVPLVPFLLVGLLAT